MPSRHVVFGEKFVDCKDNVKIVFENSNLENNLETENQLDSINLESKEHGKVSCKENKVELDRQSICSGDEVESDQESSSFQLRVLRDRNALNKPERLRDYVVLAKAFLADHDEPENYVDAVNCKDSDQWKLAMDHEINSLIQNETWESTELPKDAKPVSCKWVYKIKRKPDGSIDKFKSRLVARGFTQRFGIDYDEIYSPVTRLGSVRSLISVAACEVLKLIQFDVCSAFLYEKIRECIYMNQPQGYHDGSNRVCKLKRSIYGLK